MTRLSIIALLAFVMSAPCLAQEPPLQGASTNPSSSAPAPRVEAGDETPISLDQLAQLRAGDDVVTETTTLQTLTAANSGNSVIAERVETGVVNLSAGAFAGYNGIGNFVINTGNNNNLQGAVSVTVVMPPQ